jgi:hypothetical protein
MMDRLSEGLNRYVNNYSGRFCRSDGIRQGIILIHILQALQEKPPHTLIFLPNFPVR